MARRDIAFDAEGVTLRGWFYPAEGAAGRAPTVVMAHGFSAVKEMYLDVFAEVFAAAGLNALVFDNRNFGASDGEPRQEIDPWQQVRDYRHAITHAGTLDDVDSTRIGVWGSSYSGGHVLVLGAIDRRVKAVVAQVPLVSGSANIAELVRADFRAGFRSEVIRWPRTSFGGPEPDICLAKRSVTAAETSQYWIHTPPGGCGSRIVTSSQAAGLRRRSWSEPFRARARCRLSAPATPRRARRGRR